MCEAKTYDIKKIHREEWTANGVVILRINPDRQTYDVVDQYNLEPNRLRRLHAVLGELLTELANQEAGAEVTV